MTSKNFTKTLRLSELENNCLERIQKELNISSGSKTILELFKIYDKYKNTNSELRELRIEYRNTTEKLSRIERGLRDFKELL